MTSLALVLILAAASIHAIWNYAAKRSGGSLPFVWLTSVFSLGLYLVLGAGYWWWRRPEIPAGLGWAMVGSGLIKTAYALLLQRAYLLGDFSLVYPLTRGSGPLFATIGAIVIFGEQPTALALAGGAIIIGCVFFLAGGTNLLRAERAPPWPGWLCGLACGCCIGLYTLWDQHAVSRLQLPPVLYDGGTQLVIFAVLTPFAWRQRAEVAAAWRDHGGKAAIVGLLSSVAYLLILTAMSFTPVVYLAPAREISIVIGAFLGARLLNEADAKRRLVAAGGMAVGIVALALG